MPIQRADYSASVLFLLSRGCQCSVTHPWDAVGCFVVCECGIPGHTQMRFTITWSFINKRP